MFRAVTQSLTASRWLPAVTWVMQPTYTAEAEAYREKVQAFLAEKLPANWQGIGRLEGDELTVREGVARHAVRARYLAPGWPTRVRRRRAVARSSR